MFPWLGRLVPSGEVQSAPKSKKRAAGFFQHATCRDGCVCVCFLTGCHNCARLCVIQPWLCTWHSPCSMQALDFFLESEMHAFAGGESLEEENRKLQKKVEALEQELVSPPMLLQHVASYCIMLLARFLTRSLVPPPPPNKSQRTCMRPTCLQVTELM